MDKKEFDTKMQEIHMELDRLSSVVEDPVRILSEFYDSYRPNLVQQIFKLKGYSDADLTELLIHQLRKLPALSNCQIVQAEERPEGTLRISFREPQFDLMFLDIKGHRYESTFDSVANGLTYRLQDAEGQKRAAEENVREMKDMETRVRTICGGEIPLKKTSFAKRGALKRYLTGLKWYTKEDATRACDNTDKFLRNIQEEIDKRQSLLAEAQQEAAACAAAKDAFENNIYLQNAVRDLTELLKQNGYISCKNLEAGV